MGRFRVEVYYRNNDVSWVAIWDRVEQDYVRFNSGDVVAYCRDDRTGEILAG